jgi:hypothetical protein
MNLRGGVIIIGSLLWDNNSRKSWRDNHLSLEDKFQVYLPIRYGRLSCGRKRKNTYTMVFSNECGDKDMLGKGWVIPIKSKIDSPEALETEARAMGEAEGFSGPLCTSWGSVALLLNPKKEIPKEIKEKWVELLSSNKEDLKCLVNTHIDGEKPVIDSSGFLTVDWPNEVCPNNDIDKYELLIATVTKPTLVEGKYATPEQIADAMNKAKYYDYFRKNQEHCITTFQDSDIFQIIPTPPRFQPALE